MKPTRTKEAIDIEYTQQAAQVGHKTNLIIEQESMLERLQGDIKSHLGNMRKLRKEAEALSHQPGGDDQRTEVAAPESTPPPADTL